ncbi:MAG: sugar transferase [Magnetococcales bacterium]|nr:sugar transferase [Magnetococcales bacterium]
MEGTSTHKGFSDQFLLGGYAKERFSPARLLEHLLSLIILLLALPLFVILPILIKLHDGGPVFFRSLRLGKNKKPFHMLKFRTLVPDAERIVGGQVLSPTQRLETPIGKFMRDVRLDEIPQLINVLKGEMDFFGPRPERPAVYEAQCKSIPGYEKRFDVKPGVMGYAQLFTPHGTPKKLRSLVDGIYVRKKQKFLIDFMLGLYATVHLANISVHRALQLVWRRLIRLGRVGRAIEVRTLERMRPKGVTLTICPADGTRPCASATFMLGDINEEYLMVYTSHDLEDENLIIRLEKRFFHLQGWRKKFKAARCRGSVYKRRAFAKSPFKFAFVLHYEPETPLNSYMIQKYFIMKSIF